MCQMFNVTGVNSLRKLLLVGAILLASTAVGCGEDPDEGASGAVTKDVDQTGGDIIEDTGAGIDTQESEDTGDQPDTSGGEDTQVAEDSGPDISAPVCPGEPGCECASANDCDYPYCIDTPAGKRCAKQCVDSCSTGFKCATVPGAGGDVATICVPEGGKICNPCNKNQECAALGYSAVCVDTGDGGSFCGVDCKNTDDCTAGYECKDVKDVLGNDAKQCVVKGGGACGCSEEAIKNKLSTDCFVTAGESKCSGVRTCLAAGATGAPSGGGLTSCKAPDPEAEKCDGLDNDCDGQADEATCDDDNACTDDKCAGADGCKHTNATGDCDADDSVCTEKDKCKDGKCEPGTKLDCDDKNPCTGDTCDPKKGCKHEALSNQPCNADDNECTQSDACKDGQCAAGKLKSCDSGDTCTVGKCSVITGKCKYSAQVGIPCNDSNPCTTGETCKDESCKGAATKCDDGNPCTTDTCNSAKGGCVHAKNSDVCTDGNKCTEKDSCKDGSCVGLAISVTVTCDDSDMCTKDSCSPSKGCLHAPLSSVKCDDGNDCTKNDICDQGKCKAGTNACDCKTDSDCASKEDGNLCNGTLFCDTGASPFKCKIKESSIIKCDSSINNACQSNVCNPQAGKCELDFKPSSATCDADGSVCTKDDTCSGKGKCLAGAKVTCDDKNPCTNDACNPKTGCVYTANEGACDADGDACTSGDKCSEKTCLPGKKKNCDDDEPCTADSCDKKTGQCQSKQLTSNCDDGNACTQDDKCGLAKDGKYTCLAGGAVVCNDNNACTTDSCDSKKGCTTKAAQDGANCNDGNACTEKDACKSGSCVGSPLASGACDDKNECTIDSCDSKQGCLHKPVSGSKCSDGDECTSGDTCTSGKCVAGTNLCACQQDSDCKDQEDSSLCNGTLYCDKSAKLFKCKVKPGTVVTCDTTGDNFCRKTSCIAKTGKCVAETKADKTPCDADGSVCSVGDSCQTGKCTPGKALQCDDLNPCTADSCDAKVGCKHINQSGGCNADDNACTVNDVCTNGKCAAGKLKDCNDDEVCTSEKCDKKTGKCVYTNLVQSCDDKNVCSVGDACKKNAQGAWTCVPGAPKNCNDNNKCTTDSCDKSSKDGCVYKTDTATKHACYTGPSETRGKGICKDGTQVCTSDAKLGPCQNETKPAPKELCDAKDNTCNGVTDEGCAPTGFVARNGSASVKGAAGKNQVRATIGMSNAAGASTGGSGAKFGAKFGFYSWLMSLIGK
ncbi:MAG: hypothetical protein KC502_05910 [Myxococcales bacterium]|nr:hypothetical protein [Myxococcales bacterium]